jgi:8-oxo-dGTP pyrophosphatase MutT (NUDIX family)
MKTAAGFILARMVDGEPWFLLLQSAEHGDWLPPKGHTDGDEDALSTARRETAEEAGINDVTIVRDFERVIEYEVDTKRGNYRKQVTWLLATTKATRVKTSGEHSDAGWFKLADALERVRHAKVRETIKAAAKALRAT